MDIFHPHRTLWLAALRADGLCDATVRSYDADLRIVLATLMLSSPSSATVSAFDQSTVDGLWKSWSETGTAPATALRRLSSLKSFGRFVSSYGIDTGRLLAAIVPSVPRSNRGPVVLPPFDEVGPGGFASIDTLEAALFGLKATTGVTTAELVSIDIEDLRPAEGIILIERTHLLPRPVRPSSEAWKAIGQYRRHRRIGAVDGPLFVNARGTRLSARSVQQKYVVFRRRVGLPEGAPLAGLRNRLGYALVADGSTPAIVAAVLGLSVNSAVRYFGRSPC